MLQVKFYFDLCKKFNKLTQTIIIIIIKATTRMQNNHDISMRSSSYKATHIQIHSLDTHTYHKLINVVYVYQILTIIYIYSPIHIQTHNNKTPYIYHISLCVC